MDGMKTIRPVVEQDFANLAALITALYLVAAHVDNDTERATALEAIVDQMNALILDYHKKLARRGIGSSSQTVSTDPETPDTEEPETPDHDPDPEPEPEEPAKILKGDASGDGKISLIDLALVQRYLLGITDLTGNNYIGADASGDNKISLIDLALIQRHLLGLIVLS